MKDADAAIWERARALVSEGGGDTLSGLVAEGLALVVGRRRGGGDPLIDSALAWLVQRELERNGLGRHTAEGYELVKRLDPGLAEKVTEESQSRGMSRTPQWLIEEVTEEMKGVVLSQDNSGK